MTSNATDSAWGDQGDGTYRNPILKADYSDPDILRVGDDFYLVASDFHFVGMQVLHSKDLVNWRIVGQVYDALTMDLKYGAMTGYAQGTWAPAFRWRNGTFMIHVCTPHEGLFLWRSESPAGPWSMTTVRAADGWEDPCPFWDDDGAAYLVRSQLGAGPIILHRMAPDGARLLDDGTEVYAGDGSEGPKMFKRDGLYYILIPEGGTAHGWQTVLRSKDIYGPYERRVVLPAESPHQGGIVQLDNGEAWFMGFKTTGFLGRICHLEPVRWGDDGWPVFGDEGRHVTRWRKPSVSVPSEVVKPATSDDFRRGALAPQWQWNHNPVASHWSLVERPGFLRLKALPAPDLEHARNTLTQKLWDDAGTIDTRMEIAAMRDGQKAGVAFMCGRDFGWVGVARDAGATRIAWYDGGCGPDVADAAVWLRAEYGQSTGRLLYSLDGRVYSDTGRTFALASGCWKGARIALFCYGADGGHTDIDWFRYGYGPASASATRASRARRA